MFLLDKGISSQGFHYWGSAKFFAQTGRAFAEALVDLKKQGQGDSPLQPQPTAVYLPEMLVKEQISRMPSSERMEAMGLPWESFSMEMIDYPSPDWRTDILSVTINCESVGLHNPGGMTGRRPLGALPHEVMRDRRNSRFMMTLSIKRNVVVLAEAANEIERGTDFHNAIKNGVGR